MNLPLAFLLTAVTILVLALVYRRRAGFGFGETISHDNQTLRSQRLNLVGRPDRIVRFGKKLIVEDKKSTIRVFDSHRAQMGVYMLLVEEHYGIRPPYAVVVLGDGRREKVKNTDELQQQVLDVVERIRQARKNITEPIPVVAVRAKCRRCAQRQNCGQRAA